MLFFQFRFGDYDLSLQEIKYKLRSSDSLSVETLKFYISGIELMNEGKSVWSENNSVHLLDASLPSSQSVQLAVPPSIEFTHLKFNLGIDSVVNVSGALGGDLDPTKGMYWTWQSGYINIKLEGKSSLCLTRNHVFQFHLGGYQFPNNSLQKIVLKAGNQKTISIRLDLERFFSVFDISKHNQIISPGKVALILSEELANCFKIE